MASPPQMPPSGQAEIYELREIVAKLGAKRAEWVSIVGLDRPDAVELIRVGKELTAEWKTDKSWIRTQFAGEADLGSAFRSSLWRVTFPADASKRDFSVAAYALASFDGRIYYRSKVTRLPADISEIEVSVEPHPCGLGDGEWRSTSVSAPRLRPSPQLRRSIRKELIVPPFGSDVVEQIFAFGAICEFLGIGRPQASEWKTVTSNELPDYEYGEDVRAMLGTALSTVFGEDASGHQRRAAPQPTLSTGNSGCFTVLLVALASLFLKNP